MTRLQGGRASSPGAAAAFIVSLCALPATFLPTAAASSEPLRPAEERRADHVSPEDAKTLAAFEKRIKDYVALHRKLEATLPHLPKEATPEQIDKSQRALGELIKSERRGAKQGDLFTPDMQAWVKRQLRRVFARPDGKTLRASIMDENPGDPKLAVNERYPDTVPLSTMPAEVLESLPKLEEDLEYRFVGNRLVLLDTHPHIIVDHIENALPK